jgi:predicted PurR-regulated permease PerM
MNKTLPPSKKTVSYKAHKKDFLWQILVPILVALILVIVASVSVATGSDASTSRWADISTIWILIPLLISAFITLIILAGIIYGMSQLLNITPTYTQKLYALILLAGQKIESLADGAAKPIFFVEELSASIKSIFRQK